MTPKPLRITVAKGEHNIEIIEFDSEDCRPVYSKFRNGTKFTNFTLLLQNSTISNCYSLIQSTQVMHRRRSDL
jgi:hypothetical protein